MGSEDRQIREKQFEKAKAVFEARKAALVEKGLDTKAQGKDTILKALRAKVKKARERIAAMDAADAHVKEMAEKNTKAKKEKSQKAKDKIKAQGKGDDKKKPKPKKK